MERTLLPHTPGCACLIALQRPPSRCSHYRLAPQGWPFVTAHPSRRRRIAVLAQQDSEKEAKPSSTGNDDDGDLAIESQLSRRRAASAKRRRPLPAVSPAQQSAEQAKLEPSSQTEALVLQSLGVAFILILLEGLILAASGFLPENIDNFIIDYIYPSYSIQVGVVFACSTAYGLWKTSTTQK